jgi:hypothetical protein
MEWQYIVINEAAEWHAPMMKAVTSAWQDRIPEIIAPAVSKCPPFELMNR